MGPMSEVTWNVTTVATGENEIDDGYGKIMKINDFEYIYEINELYDGYNFLSV
jgi:hypothetical protein